MNTHNAMRRFRLLLSVAAPCAGLLTAALAAAADPPPVPGARPDPERVYWCGRSASGKHSCTFTRSNDGRWTFTLTSQGKIRLLIGIAGGQWRTMPHALYFLDSKGNRVPVPPPTPVIPPKTMPRAPGRPPIVPPGDSIPRPKPIPAPSPAPI
jgi:hypothetical protein